MTEALVRAILYLPEDAFDENNLNVLKQAWQNAQEYLPDEE